MFNKLFCYGKTIIGTFVLGSLLSSCGTIVRGRYNEVKMTSTPSGADIYVDNQFCGQTPKALKLSRSAHHICLMKEGYQPDLQKLKPQLSPIVAGNLGFVAIGAGAGAATGAILCGVSGPWAGLGILACAGLGAICGVGAAFSGAVIDCASGGGKDLCHHVHRNLVPFQLSPVDLNHTEY